MTSQSCDPAEPLATVGGCARCGGNHAGVEWQWLTRPSQFGVQQVKGWADCPTVHEPVLLVDIHDDDLDALRAEVAILQAIIAHIEAKGAR